MNNQNKRNLATTAGQQKIELPTDPTAKLRLMSWHGVSNDYDLKLAIYRELLKKQRYQKHTNRGIL